MPSTLHTVAAQEIAALDALPWWQRILLGAAALVAGIAAFAFGSVLFLGGLNLAAAWWVHLLAIVGGGLIGVSLFMNLIWIRLWFGRRMWLDRLLLQIIWRSYFWLLVAIILLLVTAARVLLANGP